MPGNTIVKQVFTALRNLHNQGFRTWVSKVREIAQKYGCDIDQPDLHTNDIKMTIKEKFVEGWRSRLRNSNRHPKLELYKELKSDFHFEPYLDLVREFKYRNALTKIRSSSHLLEIERGRHTKPKTPRNNRLCLNCKTIEDERHFVMECPLYREERCVLLSKVSNNNPTFSILSTQEKFVYLLSCKDAQILTWLGKFLHLIFKKRDTHPL